MSDRDGMHDVIDRVEAPAAVHGLYDALERDPAADQHTYGDLSVFSYDGEQPIVYEATDNRFWTDAEVERSFFGRLWDADVKAVYAHRDRDGRSVPGEYRANEFPDGVGLLATVEQSETDSVLVFERRDAEDPLVFDARAEEPVPVEDYYDSMLHAVDAACDTTDFLEMIESVEDRVGEFRPLSHFRFTSTGRRDYPRVIGIAADGEGFTLGRMRNSLDGAEQYVMARTRYDRDEPGGTRTEFEQTLAFDRRDIPSRNQMRDRRSEFGRDHILRKHADRPGEAVAALEEAYLLEPTTRL